MTYQPWLRASAFLVAFASAFAVALAPLSAAAQKPQTVQPVKPNVARARELIDSGKAAQALPLLDQTLAANPSDAQALLLRSTARFQTGDLSGGRKDLERSLSIDPRQRQAWLNRGALDLAEKRYDRALEAFQQGEKLDPGAPDNDINLGAVLLLQSDLKGASARFSRYLSAQPTSSEAHYLVASNYALAGYAALAVETLRRAVEIDERTRLRARNDPNFASLDENKAYLDLLATDSYRLPPGAYSARRTYPLPYSEDGRLVQAVVLAMRATGEKLEPTFESGRGWTILWGDLRIKVSGPPDQPGTVELSAPVERMSAADWKRRSEKLLAAITGEADKLKKTLPGKRGVS